MARDPDDYLDAAGRPPVSVTGVPLGATAAALAAGYDRWGIDGLVSSLSDLGAPLGVRIAESMNGYMTAEGQQWARQLAAITGPSAAELAATKDMMRRVEEASRPTQAMLKTMRQVERQRAEAQARSAEMAAQMRRIRPVVDDETMRQALLMGLRDYGLTEAARQAALGGARDYGLSEIAARVADLGGWKAGGALYGLRTGTPWAPERRAPYIPDREPSEDGQVARLIVPELDDIILPSDALAERRRGRPRGPVTSRDQLLDELAKGVRRLARYSSDPPVRSAVSGTNLKVATVYTYFKNEAFGWPGGRIGWPTILLVIRAHLETGRDWTDLLAELT